MVATALAVLLFLGRPILFRQTRAGFQGGPFTLIKFRTMAEPAAEAGPFLSDVDRLTGFGKWLRSTSLDELPELWNVLKGEMTLVGPRPLLPQYHERYSVEQRRRLEVKPGLTGLAQVKGRNALSWEEKFRWDVAYVEQQSFWLDLKILAMTLGQVFSRRGIAAEGEASMPEFQGNSNEED